MSPDSASDEVAATFGRSLSPGLLLHRSPSSEPHAGDAAADDLPHDVRGRAPAGLHRLRRDDLRGLQPPR
eukprot:8322319-Pyramimonas_sp.AAC.1